MLRTSRRTVETELNTLNIATGESSREKHMISRSGEALSLNTDWRTRQYVSNNVIRTIINPPLHGFWSTIHIFQTDKKRKDNFHFIKSLPIHIVTCISESPFMGTIITHKSMRGVFYLHRLPYIRKNNCCSRQIFVKARKQ